MLEAPILAYPVADAEFILDTDASDVVMGAVLSQIGPEGEKVVAYFSKTYSKAERCYRVTQKVACN